MILKQIKQGYCETFLWKISWQDSGVIIPGFEY